MRLAGEISWRIKKNSVVRESGNIRAERKGKKK